MAENIKKIISVGGVVVNEDGKIAVVKIINNVWSLPKGKSHKGEDLIDTARREIKYETGLSDLQLIKKLGQYKRFQIDENGKEDLSTLKIIHIFLF